MPFLEIVAVIFLIVFIFKILNPKIFSFIWKMIGKGFKFFIESIVYSIYLLFSRVVYVVGLVIVATLIITVAMAFINGENITTFSAFYDYFKKDIFRIYALTFFFGTYVIGLIHYTIARVRIKQSFVNFMTLKINKNFSYYVKKKYVYDEKSNKYTYKQ